MSEKDTDWKKEYYDDISPSSNLKLSKLLGVVISVEDFPGCLFLVTHCDPHVVFAFKLDSTGCPGTSVSDYFQFTRASKIELVSPSLPTTRSNMSTKSWDD